MLPWTRPQAPDPQTPAFDPRAEQSRLATEVLRRAALLLASPGGERGSAEQQVQHFCDALTEATPHLRLCWVWFGDAETTAIDPRIVAGPAAAYASELHIPRNLLTERGPAFRALSGHAPEPFNVNAWSLYPPWREAAQRHAVRAVLALPLIPPLDQRRGLFVLYADVPGYFTAVGPPLFEALAELLSSVLSHSARHRQLEHAAHTDALTGLPNRRHAQGLLDELLADAAQRPLSVMLLDLDHFKDVNDAHGHAAGDAVLAACAARLRRTLRRADGVARWGGEEFVVWLPQTAAVDAQRVAEKLRGAVAGDPFSLVGQRQRLALTASIGVAEVQPGELLRDALDRADRAMYLAKRAGRDQVVCA
jgi:diguanylate cyclase (GGDEF)-like protein